VFYDRNGDGDQDRFESAIPGIRLELLNDAGEVIATTFTGRDGRYRFTQFGESGDFQVRVVPSSRLDVTSENPAEVLISTGDQVVSGVNFGIRLARRGDSGLFNDFGDAMAAL
jgi:hypothetical protein